MSFEELIRDLGPRLGLSFSDGVASPVEIRVNELAVTLTEEGREGKPSMVLSTILGTVPQEAELAAYRVMLDANVFWTATADCTLGVNVDTRDAVICFRVPTDDVDGERLADILENFVFVAGNWANFIESLDGAGAQPDAAADEMILRI